jgi:hypothetical protein
MPQLFHPSTNTISKLSIFGALFVVVGLLFAGTAIYRSPYVTQAFVPKQQPVPFSHKHHVSGLGIDCRHCHTTVEVSAFAGIPPTKTCMTCHVQVWADSPMLEPVRASFRTDQSIEWTRVHDLPDFAYFNHSIHVSKGVGCSTCHGQVDQMPLMWQVQSLQMEWCLDCHRAPEKYIRPRDQIFNMAWQPPPDQIEQGKRLMEEYEVRNATSCSNCHR